MKKFILILALFFSGNLFAAESLATGNLTVVVTGIQTLQGNLMIACSASKENYTDMETPDYPAIVKVTDYEMNYTYKNLRLGEYAIKVYQDLDENTKITMGFFGPTEPYGFSNNVKGLFGIPAFEDAKFSLEDIEKTIYIKVN
jgi:uncharacterized protein (DUF2141 family)